MAECGLTSGEEKGFSEAELVGDRRGQDPSHGQWVENPE